MISSCWKLTYDPSGSATVLVDYGDRIDTELDFGLEKSVEVVSLVDAAAPFIRVGKNAVVNFSVTRFIDATDDKTARAAVLDALITAQTASKKPLKIEVYGYTDRSWAFASATIKSAKPRRHLESASARRAQTWDIVATGLVYTPPTP